MPDLDHPSGGPVPPDLGHDAVGRGLDGGAGRGGVIDAVVRAVDLPDGVEAAPAEARRYPGELHGRLEELLAQGIACRIEEIGSPGVRVSEPAGPECLSLVRELGRQDPAVSGRAPFEKALFEDDTERVAGLEIRVEIDVRSEDVGKLEGDEIVLAGRVDGGDGAVLDGGPEERRPDLVGDRLDLGPEPARVVPDNEEPVLVDVVLEGCPAASGGRPDADLPPGHDLPEVVHGLDLLLELMDVFREEAVLGQDLG